MNTTTETVLQRMALAAGLAVTPNTFLCPCRRTSDTNTTASIALGAIGKRASDYGHTIGSNGEGTGSRSVGRNRGRSRAYSRACRHRWGGWGRNSHVREEISRGVGAEVGKQKVGDSLELPSSYSLAPEFKCRRKIEDGRRDSTLECDIRAPPHNAHVEHDIRAPPHELTCRARIQRTC